MDQLVLVRPSTVGQDQAALIQICIVYIVIVYYPHVTILCERYHYVGAFWIPSIRRQYANLLCRAPHLVGAQLCRLSSADAHTVALKPVMGK